MIHAIRKHNEPRAHPTPDKRVRRNRAIRIHEVHIDQIIQALQEDDHDAAAGEHNGHDLRPDGDVGAGGPGEPEEADGEHDAADEHGDEAFFGDDVAGALEDGREAVFGCQDDD